VTPPEFRMFVSSNKTDTPLATRLIQEYTDRTIDHASIESGCNERGKYGELQQNFSE
jgi:hypothetical protein